MQESTEQPEVLDRVGCHIIMAFQTAEVPDGGFLSVEQMVGANITLTSPSRLEVARRLRHEVDALPGWIRPALRGSTFGAVFMPRAATHDAVKASFLTMNEIGVPTEEALDNIVECYVLLTDEHRIEVRKNLQELLRKALAARTVRKSTALVKILEHLSAVERIGDFMDP